MAASSDSLIEALKAAGEPTRLRILALLRRGDLAVGELVQILDQSQPRLSHHLKTLANSGLVERLPEGSWVFYRAMSKGWQGEVLNTLFDQLDLTQEEFAADASKLRKVRESRAKSAESYFTNIADQWDEVRAMHFPDDAIEAALLETIGTGPFKRVIDLGTGTGRMLTLFAPFAQEAEGLDLSHQMLTVARANLAAAGVGNARVRQGTVTSTPFEAQSADLIIIHQVLHFIEEPGEVLQEVARLLRPQGRLVVVDFAPHTLEFLRDEHGHRRLGIREQDMSDWANRAGLALEAPRYFAPPESLDQGLGVYIWTASLNSNLKQAAA